MLSARNQVLFLGFFALFFTPFYSQAVSLKKLKAFMNRCHHKGKTQHTWKIFDAKKMAEVEVLADQFVDHHLKSQQTVGWVHFSPTVSKFNDITGSKANIKDLESGYETVSALTALPNTAAGFIATSHAATVLIEQLPTNSFTETMLSLPVFLASFGAGIHLHTSLRNQLAQFINRFTLDSYDGMTVASYKGNSGLGGKNIYSEHFFNRIKERSGMNIPRANRTEWVEAAEVGLVLSPHSVKNEVIFQEEAERVKLFFEAVKRKALENETEVDESFQLWVEYMDERITLLAKPFSLLDKTLFKKSALKGKIKETRRLYDAFSRVIQKNTGITYEQIQNLLPSIEVESIDPHVVSGGSNESKIFVAMNRGVLFESEAIRHYLLNGYSLKVNISSNRKEIEFEFHHSEQPSEHINVSIEQKIIDDDLNSPNEVEQREFFVNKINSQVALRVQKSENPELKRKWCQKQRLHSAFSQVAKKNSGVVIGKDFAPSVDMVDTQTLPQCFN